MKAKKINKKLFLNKVTVTNLNNIELNSVQGGDSNGTDTSCECTTSAESYCCTDSCGYLSCVKICIP